MLQKRTRNRIRREGGILTGDRAQFNKVAIETLSGRRKLPAIVLNKVEFTVHDAFFQRNTANFRVVEYRNSAAKD